MSGNGEIICCRCGKPVKGKPNQMCQAEGIFYFCCENCEKEWEDNFSPVLQKKANEQIRELGYSGYNWDKIWSEVFSGFKRFESEKVSFIFR